MKQNLVRTRRKRKDHLQHNLTGSLVRRPVLDPLFSLAAFSVPVSRTPEIKNKEHCDKLKKQKNSAFSINLYLSFYRKFFLEKEIVSFPEPTTDTQLMFTQTRTMSEL